MARTLKNFKLTGKAASVELKEQREYIAEMQQAEIQRQLKTEQDAVILQCIAIEGEFSFWSWFDGDSVPNFGPTRQRIDLIKARISSLEFKTVEDRIDQIEENLLGIEFMLDGDAYLVARNELLDELFNLGDKLQVYALPIESVG